MDSITTSLLRFPWTRLLNKYNKRQNGRVVFEQRLVALRGLQKAK